MHEANIGAQFWSRDDVNVSYDNVVSTNKMFGVVSQRRMAGYPVEAAIIEMSRDLESHNVPHPDVELEDRHRQGLLYDSVPATPWKVHGLFAHEDMGHHVPALLGLAATHSKRTTGSAPEATNDLSVHSKKVVDRLVKAKLLKNPVKNASKWRSNQITRKQGGEIASAENMGRPQGKDTPVPVSDVVAASESYREAMRASRTPKAAKKKTVRAKTPDPRQASLW